MIILTVSSIALKCPVGPSLRFKDYPAVEAYLRKQYGTPETKYVRFSGTASFNGDGLSRLVCDGSKRLVTDALPGAAGLLLWLDGEAEYNATVATMPVKPELIDGPGYMSPVTVFTQAREALLDACRVNAESVLDYMGTQTEVWHSTAEDSITLREWLGLTKEEYQLWAVAPSMLVPLLQKTIQGVSHG